VESFSLRQNLGYFRQRGVAGFGRWRAGFRDVSVCIFHVYGLPYEMKKYADKNKSS